MSTRFSGQTVLLAGGTGGLGQAVSLAFLAEGASVAVTYRDQKGFDALYPPAIAVLQTQLLFSQIMQQQALMHAQAQMAQQPPPGPPPPPPEPGSDPETMQALTGALQAQAGADTHGAQAQMHGQAQAMQRESLKTQQEVVKMLQQVQRLKQMKEVRGGSGGGGEKR